MHSLFIGNPGTGKTTVARLMAQALYEEQVIKENNFVEVSRQDLVSEYIGRTATQTLEVLESAKMVYCLLMKHILWLAREIKDLVKKQ